MTLILTTIRPAEAVITSDGRSVKTQDGKITSVFDRLQKVFPVPEHPVAVAHHGENLFEGRPVGQWIVEACRRMNLGNLGLESIADELRGRMHPAIRKRLRETARSGFGCGLLIVGFGAKEREPSIVEVFWKLEKKSLVTYEQRLTPVTICTSGSGVAQIPKTDVGEINTKPLEAVRAYHARLMESAIKAKNEDNTVGGHVHELVITREGWKWTLEPAKDGR